MNVTIWHFFFQVESKNIDEAIIDEHWILVMQETSNQFERNQVWELMPRPNDHPIIGTKWFLGTNLMKMVS